LWITDTRAFFVLLPSSSNFGASDAAGPREPRAIP
jgi:hypothetical protein